MSKAFYETGGLRFWDEKEITHREAAIAALSLAVRDSLTAINRGWTFHRYDAPILTAKHRLSGEYTGDEVFILEAQLADSTFVLRPETTPSSYEVARRLLTQGKPPLCVWQAGKSFRREKSDGASPSKLRFNEFYQLEFQCIYSLGSKADYKAHVMPALLEAIVPLVSGKQSRVVDSDRLPSYSKHTSDIEVWFNNDWKEVASVSTRTDFSENEEVLEIAFGLDRLVEIAFNDSLTK